MLHLNLKVKDRLIFNLIARTNLLRRYTTNLTSTSTPNSDINFDNYKGIPPTLLSNLKSQYPQPTLVQHSVFSKVPITSNLSITSSTGSGKTVAYLVPSLVLTLRELSPFQLDYGKTCSILVVVPSRELVLQTSSVVKKLCKGLPFKTLSLIGGLSRKEDLLRINTKRVDVVVATPGRLVDLLTNSVLFREQLANLKVLVLDEADKLVDTDHLKNLKVLISNLGSPTQFKTIVTSATLTQHILQEKVLDRLLRHQPLTKIHLNKDNTTSVDVKEDSHISVIDKPNIQHNYLTVSSKLQLPILYATITNYLNTNKGKNCILFLNTKIEVDIYTQLFTDMKINSIPLHSSLTQPERQTNYQQFQNAKSCLLVTTDVSSRGIDYLNVGLVVQLGVPKDFQTFLHRSGRTARAGNVGQTMLLVNDAELIFIHKLHKEFTDLKVVKLEVDEVTKPDGSKLHELNLATDKLQKGGILKQLFRSQLTYYITINKLLNLKRKSIFKLIRNYVQSLGQLPPSFASFNNKLDKRLNQKLEMLDRAEDLVVKKRSNHRQQ